MNKAQKDRLVAEGEAAGLIPADLGDGAIVMTNCKACAAALGRLAEAYNDCRAAPHGRVGHASVKAGQEANLEALQNVSIFLVSKMAAIGAGPKAIRLLIDKTIELVGGYHRVYDDEGDGESEGASGARPTPSPGSWKRAK